MTFIDYNGFAVELSTDVWEDHIKLNHPEVVLEEIETTLKNPDEVWISRKRVDTELYYKKKGSDFSEKVRYWMVAVKTVESKKFISSAMTKSTVIGSKILFKK